MTSLDQSARFILTGPSGWIGRAMLAHIERRFGTANGRVTLFGSRAGAIELSGGETLPVRPLDTIRPEDVDRAHVIHLAYLTKEKANDLGEREFTAANIAIDDALLAALEKSLPSSLFVASSGAAALASSGVDLHPYGLGKLRQEARFLDWADRSGVSTIAGRIFNIAGPWINKLDAYAVSDFAVQALTTGRIAVRADRPVFRSFLHVDDLCGLVIGAALAGFGRANAIDLCGSEVLEMEQIAHRVASESGLTPLVERVAIESFEPSVYLGSHVDTQILAMQLGIELEPFTVQVRATIDWLTACIINDGERRPGLTVGLSATKVNPRNYCDSR